MILTRVDEAVCQDSQVPVPSADGGGADNRAQRGATTFFAVNDLHKEGREASWYQHALGCARACKSGDFRPLSVPGLQSTLHGRFAG